MFEWSEEQLAIRDAVRRFVEEEIKPNVDELEHGDTPPYEVIRKLYRPSASTRWPGTPSSASSSASSPGRARPGRARRAAGQRGPDPHPDHRAVPLLPGIVTALGVSTGLAGGTIMKQRHAGADGALGSRPADAGQDRRLGHHRAQLGLRRPGRHEVDRTARRRRVHPQRQQDLHHQRPLRRHHRLLRQARRRQRDRRCASARCSPSSSTGACPGSSSPSPSARWACTPRPPASSS